jgi:hypothetical protein
MKQHFGDSAAPVEILHLASSSPGFVATEKLFSGGFLQVCWFGEKMSLSVGVPGHGNFASEGRLDCLFWGYHQQLP